MPRRWYGSLFAETLQDEWYVEAFTLVYLPADLIARLEECASAGQRQAWTNLAYPGILNYLPHVSCFRHGLLASLSHSYFAHRHVVISSHRPLRSYPILSVLLPPPLLLIPTLWSRLLYFRAHYLAIVRPCGHNIHPYCLAVCLVIHGRRIAWFNNGNHAFAELCRPLSRVFYSRLLHELGDFDVCCCGQQHWSRCVIKDAILTVLSVLHAASIGALVAC